ncbi:aldehyde dehydrogenase 1A1 [Neodiprion lecontei]|uniref:Aldehyde dehydrogenase 1A1 n=1 Tax=Neodiprion lecontei TaxID=441921 RepID=A0A6J0CCZ3_NEOLC|nr:aldehyde dehydrogenase 1A1 [Neodiprion lecontei]
MPKPNPKQIVTYTQLFINNKWVPAAAGEKFATINPANGQKIADIAKATEVDINNAVGVAKRAFVRGSPWRRLDSSARGNLLHKLADLIVENVDELANLEALDSGKPFAKAYMEVHACSAIIRYYAGWPDKIYGKTIPVDGNALAMTRKEPIGVVGQIIPWNYPIIMMGIKIGPALAAGCTIVLKPAEQTPLTALRVASLAKEAGFPPGVLNVVPGFGPTAGAVISEHPDVVKVAFTGSTEVGHIIMQAAGKTNLKRVTLELGGKSPFVIFNEADLDEAVQIAHDNLFSNSGQTCLAPTRVFVQSGIYDEFVKKSTALAKARKVGDAFEPNVQNGPQIDAESLEKILALIESGKKEGAKLQTGGNRLGKVGFFVQPTVFSDVTDDMRIAKEEIFGPVQTIFKFDTLEEVIQRANNTNYGLAAGVCTKNIETALEFSKAMEAGVVWVNQWGALEPQAPFGGYKESGIGREMGEEALSNYLETKTISIKLPSNN